MSKLVKYVCSVICTGSIPNLHKKRSSTLISTLVIESVAAKLARENGLHASCQLYWQHHYQKEHELSPECCRMLPRTWHGVNGEESLACAPRQTPPTPPVVPCWWKLLCILKSTQCNPCRWIRQRPFHTLFSHSNQCEKTACNQLHLAS